MNTVEHPDHNHIPLTSDQARAARNYFGMSQAATASESGLALHTLKRFEARRAGQYGSFIPELDYLKSLREFYEGKGYQFDDTPEPGAKSKESGLVFNAAVVGDTGDVTEDEPVSRPIKASFHHMRIALTDPEMGHVLDLIEENEERVARLLGKAVKAGVFERFSDKTEATHGEVLKLLADNGMLFAKLFGRQIGGQPDLAALKKDAAIKTHADLLHRIHTDTHLAAKGDAGARDRIKNKTEAETLTTAIFG